MSHYSLTLTLAAQSHIKKMLSLDPAYQGLRISLKNSGCAGFAYVFDCVTQSNPEDYSFLQEGIRIFIDRALLSRLQGSKLDYVTTGLNSKLECINPNEQAQCGCGESVSFS